MSGDVTTRITSGRHTDTREDDSPCYVTLDMDFVTLSYVGGSSTGTQAHRPKILLEGLSGTTEDAIDVTRAIAVCSLRVDALYILQEHLGIRSQGIR